MLNIIVAVAENMVIGKGNRLIWHISEDLKHFRKLTLGHPVIMGRKTFESIGKPLPGRLNIILSRDPRFQVSGCVCCTSLDDAVVAAQAVDENYFVIGGGDLYRQALPQADTIYLTKIHQKYEGDTFFPEISSHWREVESVHFEKGESFDTPFSFIKLIKT
ncbi:MAG: dihydrofolate reductase [Prevotellaceae bacterium]|jgi:dihydrofolate reductase|nr:dihydrofolate reductase [Prevotellaceae bacterium]